MTHAPTIDEAALIARVRGGETDAFAELIDRHQDRLRIALGYYCRHADDVEEFLQEAFFQAYTGLTNYNSASDFYPWLHGIALNVVRKEARRRLAMRHHAPSYLRWSAAARLDPEALPSAPAVDGAAVDACIERLPAPSRGLVLAHYRDGRPLSELADELHTSLGALRVRLVRIRRLLRACLDRAATSASTGELT